MSDLIALSAAKFVAALKIAAPEVEASAPGRSLVHISAKEIHSETWVSSRTQLTDEMSAAGRLEKVDLRTHDFRVRDDAGSAVDLRHVADDQVAAQLIGTWVIARGQGVIDRFGHLVYLEAAHLETAHDPALRYSVRSPVSLESILATATGPDPVSALTLDDDEFAAFLEAARS